MDSWDVDFAYSTKQRPEQRDGTAETVPRLFVNTGGHRHDDLRHTHQDRRLK